VGGLLGGLDDHVLTAAFQPCRSCAKYESALQVTMRAYSEDQRLGARQPKLRTPLDVLCYQHVADSLFLLIRDSFSLSLNL